MKIAATAAALFVAATAGASAQPTASDRPLAVFDFFLGACWAGTFEDGVRTDTHCFRSVYGGLFVRDNHVVAGMDTPYAGETIYGWNAEEKQIAYTYWNSVGGISRGVMEPTGDGLRSPGETYRDVAGREVTIASAWRIVGPDSWEQTAEEISDGERRSLWKVTYVRRPLDSGPKP